MSTKTDDRYSYLEDTIKFLNDELKIDVRVHLEDETLSEDERYRNVKADILRALLSSWKRGDHTKDFVLPMDFDIEEFVQAKVSENTYDIVENVLLSDEDVLRLKKASGDSIRTELYRLDAVSKLIIKHKDDVGHVVEDMVEYGITAFAGICGGAASAAIIAGASVSGAVLAGLTAGGAAFLAVAVAGLVVAFMEISKAERATIGLIINETKHDVNVKNWREGFDGAKSGDLYMCHGKMVEFMEDNSTRDVTQVIAKPEKGGCYGGIYLMTKRSSAWIGVECTMKLTVGGDKVDFLSCCPMSQDNRVNLALNSNKSPSEIHGSLYDDKKQEVTKENNNIKAVAKVNSHRDSPSYVIASVTQK